MNGPIDIIQKDTHVSDPTTINYAHKRGIRAILVCVDYADLLDITLPYNRGHFDEILVVTSLKDTETQRVCEKHLCPFFMTDLFYKDGATFNKWRALERGLDVMGRNGWICIMDADVLWPKTAKVYSGLLTPGNLYSPLRYMLEDVTTLIDKTDRENTQYQVPDEKTWCQYPIHRNVGEWAGYTQIFHASDPHLDEAPWHQIDWKHAGGADSFFQAKWPGQYKVRPSWRVLHLGPAGQNWYGRASTYVDGSTPLDSEEKKKQVQQIWSDRQAIRGDGRFDNEKIKQG